MLGERNRQRQREEAERRRREEAERKRREEERRRRERIERERRIQEQISKEADDLRNKFGRAAEKRRLNTSLSGREQQHQRSHVLAQTVEDDAEGIQYKEVKIVLYMCSSYIKADHYWTNKHHSNGVSFACGPIVAQDSIHSHSFTLILSINFVQKISAFYVCIKSKCT